LYDHNDKYTCAKYKVKEICLLSFLRLRKRAEKFEQSKAKMKEILLCKT